MSVGWSSGLQQYYANAVELDEFPWVEFEVFHTNPRRAICECYLLMKDKENNK